MWTVFIEECTGTSHSWRSGSQKTPALRAQETTGGVNSACLCSRGDGNLFSVSQDRDGKEKLKKLVSNPWKKKKKKTWSNGSWQLKDWKKNNKMVFQTQWKNIMERMRLDMQENMTAPKKRQTAAWEISCRREWGSCCLPTQRFGSGVKLETVTLISSEMIPLTVHWEKGRTEVDVREKST